MTDVVERLIFATLWWTGDVHKAMCSRLIWADRGDGYYRMTPLGLLNTTLYYMGLELSLDVP